MSNTNVSVRSIAFGVLLVFAMLFLAAQPVAAHEDNGNAAVTGSVEARSSINSDSFLQWLDRAIDRLGTVLARNPEVKAQESLEVARERLLEARAMIAANITGKAEAAKTKAESRIGDAVDAIAEAEAKLSNANLTNSTGFTARAQLLAQAKAKLSTAQSAFNESKFGRAFGLANAAVQLAENSNRIIDGQIELKAKHELLINATPQISAKVFSNQSQIKLRLEFLANATSKEAIAREIAARLNLSSGEISSLLKMRNQSGPAVLAEEVKAEAKVKGNLSIVRVELDFPLNETGRAGIVSGISQRIVEFRAGNITAILEMKTFVSKKIEAEVKEKKEKKGHKNGKGPKEAEVEVEGGVARVKVMMANGSKLRYTVPFTSEADLFADIAARTGLSADEVRLIAKIEGDGSGRIGKGKADGKLHAEGRIEAEIDGDDDVEAAGTVIKKLKIKLWD